MLTSCKRDVQSAPPGSRRPRIRSVPPYRSSAGAEAIELAALAGLDLDPWQQDVIVDSLGETDEFVWAAPEVALVCPRQNGKNAILEARELAGLFLVGERLIIHSAHQYDTSIEAYRRLRFLVENTPELHRRVNRYNATHGEEGIELRSSPVISAGPGGLVRSPAPRIRFRTRTKGGGRGFSGDCVIFDEAMIFPEASLAAILPIVSARPNPQIWYTGSSVDQVIHEQGYVLARVRERGLKGDDPRLAYFEWSVDRKTPTDVEPDVANAPESWAQANPALGIRISPEYVSGERAAMGARNFAVERLGVGDWPNPDMVEESVIDMDEWAEHEDRDAEFEEPFAVAFDVSPDRSSSAIGCAGLSTDGYPMVEVAMEGAGTSWVVPAVLKIVREQKPLVVACDAVGAAASLMLELEKEGVEVVAMSARDHANATGGLYDDATEGDLVHLGQMSLTAAVRGATQRPLGGAWAWNRKTSAVDICPLVACTLALGAYRIKSAEKPKAAPRVINLADID
jgi:hypothetical protein